MLAFTALAGASALIGMGAFSRRETAHRARTAGLDVNIHVNGIRGKSTVTRMIGGVLREAGVHTIAKTTGTYACVIDTDGGEHPIRRTGPANINEQYRFVRDWIDDDVTALVVECMAVKPKLQKICQDQILRSPIGVITNVRLDHQDELGETLEEIAASLCNTVPENGTVVTSERDPALVEIIRTHCEARGSRLIVAEASIDSRELLERFDYRQFEENVAVVLEVARLLNIDQQVAVRGMLGAHPDPGTTRIATVSDGTGADLHWVPMFAINDWQSTLQVFDTVVTENLPSGSRTVIALNNRADRTDRAAMFIDLVSTELADRIDRVVLYGDIQEAVRRKLIARGLPASTIVTTDDVDQDDGRALLARAREGFAAGDEVALLGMVNIHTPQVRAMERYVSAVLDGSSATTAPTTAAPATAPYTQPLVPATSEDAGTAPLGSIVVTGRPPLVEEPVTLTARTRRLYGATVLIAEPVELRSERQVVAS
ncbi:poly-gamma-glutamate synthase PgsB [Gordonia sp. VNK21]|uniref:poly-gamma-glutamate synthase PgsB n=1 Tax=Gordonia sp. VNK21 TaxID=3382483 RepID=UPI0038D4BBB6